MKKIQQARYDADQRGQAFCLKYKTPLEAIGDDYLVPKALMDEKITDVGKAAQAQTPDTTVITEDKQLDKEGMGDVVYKFMLRAAVRASLSTAEGAKELASALNKPLTYITDANDQPAINRATDLKDLMKNNRTTIVTNITDDDVEEMEAAIDSFAGIKNKNKEAVEEKKAEGTDKIDDLLDEVDVPKGLIGKLVYSYLPKQAHEWELMIKVGKAAGIRHLDLVIKYVDDATGEVMRGVKATIACVDSTLEETSSKLGYVRGYSMESANWSITSKKKGYKDDVKTNVGIGSDGKIVRMEVRMVKL